MYEELNKEKKQMGMPRWVEISGVLPFYMVRAEHDNYAGPSLLCAQLVYREAKKEKKQKSATSLGRDLRRCSPLAVLRSAFSTI